MSIIHAVANPWNGGGVFLVSDGATRQIRFVDTIELEVHDTITPPFYLEMAYCAYVGI